MPSVAATLCTPPRPLTLGRMYVKSKSKPASLNLVQALGRDCLRIAAGSVALRALTCAGGCRHTPALLLGHERPHSAHDVQRAVRSAGCAGGKGGGEQAGAHGGWGRRAACAPPHLPPCSVPCPCRSCWWPGAGAIFVKSVSAGEQARQGGALSTWKSRKVTREPPCAQSLIQTAPCRLESVGACAGRPEWPTPIRGSSRCAARGTLRANRACKLLHRSRVRGTVILWGT